jgi:hypothetical protein
MVHLKNNKNGPSASTTSRLQPSFFNMGKKAKLRAGSNNLANREPDCLAREDPIHRPDANNGQMYDAKAASRIQKLYRRCRPHAFQEVTEAESPFCEIPAEELHEHSSRVFSSRGLPLQVLPTHVPASNDHNLFEADFTAQEVWKHLCRCSNTAPGLDGIRYSVWKKFDEGTHVLSTIFNCVKRLGAIPGSWTKSTTVLIHKKGNRNDISNWRPISMSNIIAKIYSSVLAERLGSSQPMDQPKSKRIHADERLYRT